MAKEYANRVKDNKRKLNDKLNDKWLETNEFYKKDACWIRKTIKGGNVCIRITWQYKN